MRREFYAPVLCNVTIQYAISSTKRSSLLIDAYFVALSQNVDSSLIFSENICSLNDSLFVLIG